MDHHRIYLSGPIAGLTYDEATRWRHDVYEELADFAEILDPMRDVGAGDTETLEDTFGALGSARSTADPVMSTDRGIVTRDYTDTITSTILFVNLLGAKKASIGTIAEIAWGYDCKHMRTIVVMEPSGNPHEHPFIREMADYRVDTIERGILVARSIMGIPQQW